MKRVLCIWLPDWPIQRLVVERPELKSHPIVLHARDPRRGQRVVACCQQARQRGVRTGMSLAEVSALSQQQAVPSRIADGAERPRNSGMRSTPPEPSPAGNAALGVGEIHFQQHDPAQDRSTLEQLAVWCERFSPIVGLESGKAPESLLLDVTGLGRLFGSERQLAQRAVREFSRRHYRVHVAVADTIGVAWAVAHFGEELEDWHVNHCRKCGMGTPARHRTQDGQDGQECPSYDNCFDAGPKGFPESQSSQQRAPSSTFLIVPEGDPLDSLGPLPIECLRLPDEAVRLLAQLGVHCVGQLLALPRDGLATRFGAQLIDRLDQALGKQREVIVAYRPRPAFEASWSLESPTDRRAEIEAILTHLVGHLAQLLSAQDQGAVQVECRFDCVDDRPVDIHVGLFQPTANSRHLYDLLRMQLETVKLRKPVSAMRLCAVTTVRLKGRQHELWNDPFQAAASELASLIDRLSSRLGPQQVVRVRPQASALPELAYGEVSLTDAQPKRRRSTAKPPSFTPLQRPLWLQNPPLALPTVSVATDGPPIFFRYQNRQHDVARHWGPERIETAWWRGRCVRRDYYRVETAEGNRFWLFRSLADGQWFLHGCFE